MSWQDCFYSCNILLFLFSSFCQEAKKKYDKETEKYCGILEKHLNLSSKKKESQLQEVRNFSSILNKVFKFCVVQGMRAGSPLPENPEVWKDLTNQELDLDPSSDACCLYCPCIFPRTAPLFWLSNLLVGWVQVLLVKIKHLLIGQP